jgi:hypothetical protein
VQAGQGLSRGQRTHDPPAQNAAACHQPGEPPKGLLVVGSQLLDADVGKRRGSGAQCRFVEPAEAITTVENVLRDLIETTLRQRDGAEWWERTGLTPERRTEIEKRRDEETRRRTGGVVEQRLLYYSDFTDLIPILKKNWGDFSNCLGDWKTISVYLDRLGDFRNPEMHGRELLPFERHLVLGMSDEIRNKVTIYRSGRGPDREYFARIESVRDSFGKVASPDNRHVDTGLTLRPGDEVTFECKGWDPEGKPLLWRYTVRPGTFFPELPTPATFTWHVSEQHIAERQHVAIYLIAERQYHRHGDHDDMVLFRYRVLPLE